MEERNVYIKKIVGCTVITYTNTKEKNINCKHKLFGMILLLHTQKGNKK